MLRKALLIEEKKLKAAQKLDRRLQLTKMTHYEREKVWMEEMSEGILGGQEEVGVAEGGVAVEGGSTVGKRPVRAEERKTKKQRRKEILRKKEVSLL